MTRGRARADAAPLGAAEFAARMAQCGPFEPRPLVAVAVSGGADSMALALLAADWARALKGRALALTIDHGLRAESTAEAGRVARWMKAHGIRHYVLVWRGPKPKAGLQAAARAARYRLLEDWCRARGVLHLLLAHHRADQAETVLMRLAAGSGPFGLAGMAPVQETASLRIVRPLLEIAPTRLTAMLRAAGQPWIEDPSNRDPRFTRVRVRSRLDAATAAKIAAAAAELGRFRAADEHAVAGVLARSVSLHPDGHAWLDGATLAGAPAALARRALAALLATVGGRAFAPGDDDVRKLLSAVIAVPLAAGRTLGGCRLAPTGGAILVARETRGVETRHLGADAILWDGRFLVRAPRGTTVAALGADGWAEAVGRAPVLRETPVPYPARLSLPALRDAHGLVAIPSLGFRRTPARGRHQAASARFRPRRALAPAVFAACPVRRVALETGGSPVV